LTKKTIYVVVFIAMLLLIALPSVLSAQEQPEPRPLRFDFTPFIGYRTSMSFPIEPHVTGANPRVTLDASPSYGVSFGVRFHEDDLVEARWARQDSYVHSEDIMPQPPRQRVILDQFHVDSSHEYLVDDWASWAKPFVMGSAGGFVDPHVAFICGPGCIVHVGGTLYTGTSDIPHPERKVGLSFLADPNLGPSCFLRCRYSLTSGSRNLSRLSHVGCPESHQGGQADPRIISVNLHDALH
jgi:hypothetical protein